ncbi:MAG TPA: ABC transporter ATP-binding protein [Chloroflexia bacterium]|nr:ABC transporter ATP-binding protein [Chloroflexia bacterium]
MDAVRNEAPAAMVAGDNAAGRNAAAPAIVVTGLVKQFGGLRALDGISLTVPRGMIYGLLGPNGAGKTTLIRSLLGLVRPDAGTIQVLGQPVPAAAPAVRALTGYMTQVPALYGDLSVGENLTFFARVFGLGAAAARAARIQEVLGLVDLLDRQNTLVANLSGGMRQRVSLACALVHRPQLLLLDEPTVGVDPQLRYSFWSYFRRLAGEGVTIVVSSHVMDEAARCDRLGLLRAGRLLAEGTAASLCAQTGQPTLEDAFLALAGVSSPETVPTQ